MSGWLARSTRVAGSLVCAAAATLLVAATPAGKPAAGQRGMEIRLVSPPGGTPAFGEVDHAVRGKSPGARHLVDK
jgi:hypothetical protein